jgi:rRNA maturation RNase YbeY
MRRLNRQYRRIDRSTDVLAFPMRESRGPASSLLGDVVISLHTAARQALAERQSLDHQVAILLIHGIVHLLGFDHERGQKEARRMHRKERALLNALMPLPRLIRHEA